jgi:CRP/FNR family transcriptional regulator, nitrogen fixation regulation protein
MSISVETARPLTRLVPAATPSLPAMRTLSTMGIGTLGDYIDPTVLPTSARATWNNEALSDLPGTIVPFSSGSQLYGAGDPTDYLYSIVSGVARCYQVTADGRRQIVGFYLPGDLFGFGCGSKHMLSADAVGKSKVRMMKLTAVTALAARDEEIAQRLWTGLVVELCRDRRHILRLGTTARARVASFLLEMARRTSDTDGVDLPMPRQDIADYLSISLETVSRALTQLTSMSAITLFGTRKIKIRDHKLLKRLTCETISTR